MHACRSTLEDPTYGAGEDYPLRVVVGDFNEDTWLDILTANYTAGQLALLLNEQDGTFAAPQFVTTLQNPSRLIAGDANGDNHVDVGVVGINATKVHFGTGLGSFATLAPSFPHAGYTPEDIAFGDFNGNGRMDVAVAGQPISGPGAPETSAIRVFYRSAAGEYPTTVDVALPDDSSVVLAAHDLDGDGLDDVIASRSFGGEAVSIILSSGAAFEAPVNYVTSEEGEAIGVGDINEDGKTDLVIGSANGFDAPILLGNGDGTFSTDHTFDLSTFQHIYAVALGDINNDFRTDVILLDSDNEAFRFINDCPDRFVGVALTSSPQPSTYGTNITLTATVTSNGGDQPAGTVSFFEGDVLLGTQTLAGGTASQSVTKPAIGTHLYYAVYSGDATYGTSTSPNRTHTVNRPPFGAPRDLTATGDSVLDRVVLTWVETNDVTLTEISRLNNGSWSVIGTTENETFTDLTVNPSNVYAYRARSFNGGTPSTFTTPELATAFAFTTPSLVGQKIRTTDVTELRSLIATLRTAASLSAFTFTDTNLGGIAVRAVHVTQLRTALNEALTAIGRSTPSYSQPTLTAGTTRIKEVDIEQIRAQLR